MPRQARIAPPGYAYHVMNRTAGRFIMLREEEDFAAFERILLEAHRREPLPILAWCLLGNHWHFVVKPTQAGQMTRFFRWLTLTHAMRWRVAHRSVGAGHLYRGRYRAFPVQGPETGTQIILLGAWLPPDHMLARAYLSRDGNGAAADLPQSGYDVLPSRPCGQPLID